MIGVESTSVPLQKYPPPPLPPPPQKKSNAIRYILFEVKYCLKKSMF